MDESVIERIIFTHYTQVALAVILSLMFYLFNKTFNRTFLKWLAVSWLCYALLYVASIMLNTPNQAIKPISSFLFMYFTYLQLYFVIVGILEYTKSKKIKPRQVLISCSVFLH